jgi:hypothetical protein
MHKLFVNVFVNQTRSFVMLVRDNYIDWDIGTHVK